MHDSSNYHFYTKSKKKTFSKPGRGVRLSNNPSINSFVTTPDTPTFTSSAMAFSHTFQNYLPPTVASVPVRQLPERLKPREPETINPEKEEENLLLDLVIVAEFSEQEGPRPLIVLDEGYDESLFDANSFAVRIMSVDASLPPTIGVMENVSDEFVHRDYDAAFRLAQDSVVIHLETADDRVVSHVRHFTLYDLEARGFVRPFCVAYVTQNPDKLVRRHDLIDAKFSEATTALKRGNFHQFSRELQKRLVDLGYTKGRMIEWNQVKRLST